MLIHWMVDTVVLRGCNLIGSWTFYDSWNYVNSVLYSLNVKKSFKGYENYWKSIIRLVSFKELKKVE